MKEFATLAEFAAYAKGRVALVEEATQRYRTTTNLPGWWETLYLNPDPNEDECRFCRAMSTCPAWAGKVEDTLGMTLQAAADCFTAGDDLPVPTDDDRLALMMSVVGGFEDLAKAVRAEVERRLMLGQDVKGWGLELGRQGARAWTDRSAAEAMLRKTMRLPIEVVYDMELKSPTSIEKLAPRYGKAGNLLPPKKGDAEPIIGPRQWKALQPLIGRAPAKPSVKPLREIKEPWTPTAPSTDTFSVEDDDNLA